MLLAAILAGYGALAREREYRVGPDSRRVFAGFARLEVTPAQWARMRGPLAPLTAKPPGAEWRRIVEVVDGDSVKLDNGTSVRLLGVDTPESSENRKFYADLGKLGLADAKRDMLALGRTAAQTARDRAEGRLCWLETEGRSKDDYGRTLAVVHLEDGTILNEWLLSEGYARVYLGYSFQYRKRYIALQSMAEREGRGFWSP